MKFSNLKNAVFYPLAVWLIFDIIAFIFGFSAFPDLAKAFLLSDVTPFFLSIMFGMWIGNESYGTFKVAATARNALIVSFITGAIIVLLSITLINSSQGFLTYVTSIYTSNGYITGQAPILNLAVSTWFGSIFVTIVSSVAAFSFISKLKQKR